MNSTLKKIEYEIDFKKYCFKCKGACCDTRNTVINIRPWEFESLELFIKNCKTIYDYSNLDNEVIKTYFRFINDGIPPPKLLNNKGESLKIPCLIEYKLPVSIKGNEIIWSGFPEFFVYSKNYCPFYNPDKKLCLVHEDSRRPKACKTYPFMEDQVLNELLIQESCPQHLNMLKDLKSKFQEL